MAAAFALGIVLDRYLPAPLLIWLAAGFVAWCAWLVLFCSKRNALAAGCVLVSIFFLGAARHHARWSVYQPNDIAQFASDEARPIRIVGVIAAKPAIIERPSDSVMLPYPQYDRSVCAIDCESIATSNGERNVSGRVRLNVTGHLLHVEVGDRVAIDGWLKLISPPRNPGQFDYRDYLRRQRQRCEIFTEYPQAVEPIGGDQARPLARALSRLYDRCDYLLVQHVDNSRLGVAEALLLGSRAQFSAEMREEFVESGTMHLLAISGMHVVILYGFLWIVCRSLNISTTMTALIVLAMIVAYTMLVGAQPSVVRATILIAITVIGQVGFRESRLENALAVSALLILLFNPTDLFDVGAQLSFLAVGGIIWSVEYQRSRVRDAEDLATLLAPQTRVQRTLRFSKNWLQANYAMMTAIWVATAPLIAMSFHLVSPIGLLVNIVLIPVVSGLLCLGNVFLMVGVLFPSIAWILGDPFDQLLRFVLAVVAAASRLQLGHLYVAGPSLFWLIPFYALIGVILLPEIPSRWKRRATIGLLGTTAAGLLVSLLPERPDGLRCTFLSVGHGCSVLIETPNNRTMLYDAGSLSNGRIAAQTVESALWSAGHSRLDGVILSHADIDHFNGVPDLIDTLPIGGLFIARQFLDFEQPPVEELCNLASAENIPIRLIHAGDELRLDDEVAVRLLYPAPGSKSIEDNANSIVLEIEYAGRRILLTGDLEGDGLTNLFTLEPRKVDVLLSPHHGGRTANTSDLARWSDPDMVIVSGDSRVALEPLRQVYGAGATVLNTSHSGAIACTISKDGELRVATGATAW